MVQRCQQFVEANQGLLRNIGSKMLPKLKTYEQTVCTPYAKVEKILDPRFTSSYATDDLILRPFLQSTYPLTARVTDEAINGTSNFLLDVVACPAIDSS